LQRLRLPEGQPKIRVDSGVEEGGEVTPFYDPMIAKIIAHAPTRREAARALEAACASVEVYPVKTNAAFLALCLGDPDFLSGEVDTGFIPARSDVLTGPGRPSQTALGAAYLAFAQAQGSAAGPFGPVSGATGFRLNGAPALSVDIHLEKEALALRLPAAPSAKSVSALLTGSGTVVVFERGRAFALSERAPLAGGVAAPGADGRLIAPMPGRIVSVGGALGAQVRRGETLMVLEAMKMEHALVAPFDGTLAEVLAATGDQVFEGALLLRVTPA
jgi:acetyl/propionyl-CoA carboxylase alpha subunit